MFSAISIALHLAGLGFLLFLSAFFSGSETALFSLSKIQVERLRQESSRSGNIVAQLLDNPRRLLITILVGNMFVNVASASLIASFATNLLGNQGAGVAVFVTTVLLLIFGEVTPKTIAVHNAETISRTISYPILLFSYIIFPLRIVLRTTTNVIMRLIAGESIPIEDRFTTEELKAMIEAAEEEGSIKGHEKDMLDTIFDLRNITAAEIMVPRTEMVCASELETLQDIFDLAREAGRSRIPVYRDDVDHIFGILYIRDFSIWRHHDIMNMTIKKFMENRQKLWEREKDTLIRKPLFVPESRTAIGLLQDLRSRGVQIAILLDEYGGTAGLVTMEDLVEELVGEITDEYDDDVEDFRFIDDLTVMVSGGISVRRINKKLGLNLPIHEDIDTIGGYLLQLLGSIPKGGEVVKVDDVEFKISGLDKQIITNIMVKKPEVKEEDDKESEKQIGL
ncbi:DUF21 domain-containing protein [Candidatus Poribacteria bacterium]|nr:DUF21 domain-containing protein [Candidatus Poribacteria bacterium]